MKSFRHLLGAGVLALLTLGACTTEHDDLYYAENATISSDDASFKATGDGGTLSFSSEGGYAIIYVDCGTDWYAENYAEDYFEASANVKSGSLIVTASQNTVTEQRTGSIVLLTSASKVQFATITVTQEAYTVPGISLGATEWLAPAVGALSTEISLTSSFTDLSAESDSDWLSAELTGSGISLTAEENAETEKRSAVVTVTGTDGIESGSATISVVQDGRAYLTLSKDECVFYEDAGTSSVTVESNYAWDCSYDTSNGWFSIEVSGDSLIATVSANDTSADREGTVTITAGDGAENVAVATVTVIQYGPSPEDLILQYTVSSGTEITLPLDGTVDCTVDWGDDSAVETFTESPYTHTYEAAGTYTVRISGTVTGLNSYNVSSDARSYLTGVIQWGLTGLTSMYRALYYCSNIKSIPTDTAGSFADVTTFSYAFYRTAITEIPETLFRHATKATNFSDVFYWCTSLATIPSGLFEKNTEATQFGESFRQCNALTEIPSGLFANNSKAESFETAFFQCKLLTSIPEDLFANCPEATDFSDCFEQCSGLTSVPGKLFEKCTKADNFMATFYDCSAITTLGEGLFSTCTEVTDFSYTFGNCKSLTAIPDGLFSACSKVETFDVVFSSCSSLTSIPEGLFDACTAVTSFNTAFSGCSSLTTIQETLFAKNTAVTDFGEAFNGCSSLTSIPEGLFAANTAATSFSKTFGSCTSLTSIPKGLFAKNAEAQDFSSTFNGCTALTEIPAALFDGNLKAYKFTSTFSGCESVTGESPYTAVNGVNVHLYERSAHTDYFSPAKSLTGTTCFKGCDGLTDINAIKSNGWY